MCASGGKQLCLVFVCSSRFILHMLSVYHPCCIGVSFVSHECFFSPQVVQDCMH